MFTEDLKKETHFQTICRWWESHGWPIIPWEALPRTALITYGPDGRPGAAGWLYSTDGNAAWLEYVVKNPELLPENTDVVLNALVTALCDRAKSLGFALVFTCSNKQRLIDRYESLGFVKTDENVSHFIRRL